MRNIQKINNQLKAINKRLYIVGGFCRDYFIAQKKVGYEDFHTLQNTKNLQDFQDTRIDGDIDLVTDATPDEIKQVLTVVGEVGQKYGTCIILEGGDDFELTTFRKDIGSINHRKPAEVCFTDSLKEDSKRRDFTCNAIYYDVENESFINPQGGISDIQNGVIRFVGDIEKRIEEDVIRTLRFVRFKNKYGFESEKVGYECIRTLQILKKTSHLLKNIPAERIRQELDKILLLDNSNIYPFTKGSTQRGRDSVANISALQDLKKINFFKHIIPELDCLDQCLGNKYHLEGDVWTHTLMCVKEMSQIIKRDKITGERAQMLLRATLLHDIGKGPTYSLGEDGEGHYYDHENTGAEMFKTNLASRLKFSNSLIKEIYFLIKQHLRVFLIPEMKKMKSRKLMMKEYFPDLLLLGEADNRGRIPVKEEAFQKICNIYSEFQIILESKSFLTGEDIMKKYPDLEGRKIGERLMDLNNQILIKD